MRARDQVWSEENESGDAQPRPEQPQPKQATPAPRERPEAQPADPKTPAAEPPAEKTGQVNPLPCVHVLEAFFAALATADAPAILSAAAAVIPDGRNGNAGAVPAPEAPPGAALAGLAIGSLLLHQQDRVCRKAQEQERHTRRAALVR